MMNKWFSSSRLCLLHLLEPLGAASTSNCEQDGGSSLSVRFCRKFHRTEWILSAHARPVWIRLQPQALQSPSRKKEPPRFVVADAARRRCVKSNWYRIQSGANKDEREDKRTGLVCCLGKEENVQTRLLRHLPYGGPAKYGCLPRSSRWGWRLFELSPPKISCSS